jgi:hypothetical protein
MITRQHETHDGTGSLTRSSRSTSFFLRYTAISKILNERNLKLALCASFYLQKLHHRHCQRLACLLHNSQSLLHHLRFPSQVYGWPFCFWPASSLLSCYKCFNKCHNLNNIDGSLTSTCQILPHNLCFCKR